MHDLRQMSIFPCYFQCYAIHTKSELDERTLTLKYPAITHASLIQRGRSEVKALHALFCVCFALVKPQQLQSSLLVIFLVLWLVLVKMLNILWCNSQQRRFHKKAWNAWNTKGMKILLIFTNLCQNVMTFYSHFDSQIVHTYKQAQHTWSCFFFF